MGTVTEDGKEEKCPKCPEPFTAPGKCLDEVRLVFDDQQELYVSQNFLILSSPVFEAMFKNDLKEKQQSAVLLKEKSYTDFYEFLMCIYPGTLKPVTEANVLRIVPIAEEYQVDSIIQSCKSVMKNWLEKDYVSAKKLYNNSCNYHVVQTRQCLSILATSLPLNYKSLVDNAVDMLAKMPHRIYYGSYGPDTLDTYCQSYKLNVNGKQITVREIIDECKTVFQTLPAELRCTILSKRLAFDSDNEVK
ncbi:uncharacterized protein LOC132750171 [Ruditapes philippinarum]|uniref:uncharacterized protein LOC132750171 n=1 Tax=Ruditapes philippinarum TaxID=129788 RepID=UPI00295AED05|nr:uncharacterized protein LOC132750171 [Ruditapes philippinarum]XP_060596108.1 uncharacterized protein LOC132750171 [Ruditapes philippinarum]